MSTIREHVTYTAHCGGCGNMYGDTFDIKAPAEKFVADYPLCFICDSESDQS